MQTRALQRKKVEFRDTHTRAYTYTHTHTPKSVTAVPHLLPAGPPVAVASVKGHLQTTI